MQFVLDYNQPGRHYRAVSSGEPIRGNLAPMPGVFPDYKAPIVRNGAEGRELATARWGMPSSAHALMAANKHKGKMGIAVQAAAARAGLPKADAA